MTTKLHNRITWKTNVFSGGHEGFTVEKMVGFLILYLKDKLDDLFSGYPGQLMSFIFKTVTER